MPGKAAAAISSSRTRRQNFQTDVGEETSIKSLLKLTLKVLRVPGGLLNIWILVQPAG